MNPYAERWRSLKAGEHPLEQVAIEFEAKQAEATPTETCGKCGSTAYYRPGVGAHQCPECSSLLIIRKEDGLWVEEWI
jgi:ribosomal protein L37AE/L43A